MAGILDMLFRLTPVEPEEAAAELEIEQLRIPETPPIVPPMVQSTQARQTGPDAQAVAPEDAQAVMPELDTAQVQRMLDERDARIASLSEKVEQLIRYGSAQGVQDTQAAQTQPAQLTPDAPEDYVPLRELDFSRDGKF